MASVMYPPWTRSNLTPIAACLTISSFVLKVHCRYAKYICARRSVTMSWWAMTAVCDDPHNQPQAAPLDIHL